MQFHYQEGRIVSTKSIIYIFGVSHNLVKGKKVDILKKCAKNSMFAKQYVKYVQNM